MNGSGGVTAKKTESHDIKNTAEKKSLFALSIITAILIIAAVLSMFINTGHPSNFCSSQFTSQQKYDCLESLAVSSNNSTACASLSGSYKDGCYSQIAAKENNIRLCGAVSNSTSSAACTMQIANNTGSYKYCLQLGQPYHDSCLYYIGTGYKNASACSSITNNSLSLTCAYSIYYAKALEQKSSSYCSLIGNGTYAQSTAMLNSTQFSNISTTTENLAIISYYYNSYMNISISPRDLCYYSLAYQSNESAYCSGISNPSFGAICKKTYTINATANSSHYYDNLSKLCSSYGGNICPYSTILNAISSKNATECQSLNTSESATCFASMASYYSNSSYCQYISNVTLNGACVDSVLYNNSTNSSA